MPKPQPVYPLNYKWGIVLILILVFTGVCVILLGVLIANLKSSGDIFASVIGDMQNADFPGEIRNGIMGLISIIHSETGSVRSMLTNTHSCIIEETDIDDWKLNGKDSTNNKFNGFVLFGQQNIHNIHPLCTIQNDGTNGSSIPVIEGSLGYFTDSGNITCFHIYSCEIIWKKSISTILGYPDNIIIPTFTSPSIFKNYRGIEGIIFGSIGSRKDIINSDTGLIDITTAKTIQCKTIALNRFTGETLFITMVGSGLNRDYFCEQRTAYTIFEDKAFSGLDSSNDYFSRGHNGFNYDVTFQGSVHAINITTGELIWKTFLLNGPLNGYSGGFSGGGVSGSNPPIVSDYRMIFFANNNLFNYTQDVHDCLFTNLIHEPDTVEIDYLPYFLCEDLSLERGESINHDSIIGLSLDTGMILWTSKGINKRNGFGIDSRTNGCKNGLLYQDDEMDNPDEYCVVKFPGPGFGFNDQPIVFNLNNEWRVTGFSKGGVLFSFNALNGDSRWNQNVSPGSDKNHNGIAFNPIIQMIFVTVSGMEPLSLFRPDTLTYDSLVSKNQFHTTLANGTELCNSGLIYGIDSRSGDIIWESLLPYSYDNYCNPSDYINHDTGFTTEVFKELTNFTSIDGNPSLPASVTTQNTVIPTCDSYVLTTTILSDHQFSKTFGNPTTITFYGSHLLFVPTLLGSVLILDAQNGHCLNDISCPSGGIVSGVVIIHDKILFSCGTSGIFNDPLVDQLLNGNTLLISTL